MKRLVLIVITTAAATLIGCSPSHKKSSTEAAKVQTGSAPAQVTAAFQKDHPSSMIKKVEKETYPNGTIHYEFTFIDDTGRQQTVEYSAAGEQLPEH